MEFKGTKGNWSEMIGGFSKKGGEPNMVQIYSANNELELICKVYKDNQLMTNQDFRANAQLIAASPDLLEALQEVKEFLGHIELRVGEAAFNEIWNTTDEAINKALGL